ncbi:flagellin N-terminal helical domain-containing protein [Bosea minatitlanensis]|uniref:Flagellin n=1 Tax=Bosea minatitlanensis TaxID=128782 RepID=A0ABW0F210_9HYPH|nr:flagellin [Bosea minatitlanensis]MCT4492204.1 flagellin [Bosea minatitlanensis]
MAISLSANVRNNLTSLQSITAQAAAVQNRLATGKKVNTAVDNPVNYFTAQSLNSRSDALKGLLDGMSNGIQTIQAASKGIDGITKLVNSMQSTIKQAQSDAAQNRPTATGTALVSTAEKIATNKSLKDIALDKAIVNDNGADADAATASYAGNIGVAAPAAGTAGKMLAISIKAGDNAYEATFNAANMTVRDVVNEINKSGIATAFVDEKGQFNVKGTGSETLQFGFGAADITAANPAAPTDTELETARTAALTNSKDNDATTPLNSNAALGLASNSYDVGTTASNVTSAVRSNLIQQFNDLRTQIDELAKDSSFNGINLLAGDQLSIAFNEKTGANQSKMNIQGSVVTAENLGISQAVNTQIDGLFNFQNDNDLGKASDALNSALTSLKSLSSTFGAQLSVANTRQDFTKGLADTLTVGADNLVNADANEEAANLLSLQTRQQLSQTALSLASQSDQAVLRLF